MGIELIDVQGKIEPLSIGNGAWFSGWRSYRSLDIDQHLGALRLAVLREGGSFKETPATGNEGKFLYAHLRTYLQPTQLFAARASLQPTPSPLFELA